MSSSAASVLPVILAMYLVACSSSSAPASPVATGADAGPSDAAATTSDARAEAAADVARYPAFQATPPTVEDQGGPVLKSAHVVPVFFANDANQAAVVDFAGKYLASPEWSAATAEYGIVSAVAMPAVVAPDLPQGTASPVQFEAWLTSQLDGTHPAWGTVDDATLANTVFVFFTPPGSLYPPNASPMSLLCLYAGGWHAHTTPPIAPQDAGVTEAGAGTVPGTPVVYAIVGECASTPGWDPGISEVASHELVEAFTDPFPDTAPANSGLDPLDAYWASALGSELADMCDATPSEYYTPATLGYAIQRTWSRKAVAAGQDPCQPLPPGTGPYFNSVPETPDTFTDPTYGVPVHGVIIPAGKSRTIDVHLFSESATSDWPVAASVPNQQPKFLTFAFDRSTGNNGDVLHLTITAPGVELAGAPLPFVVISGSAARQTFWVGEVLVQ